MRARYDQEAAPHAGVIEQFRHGIHIWAEANRSELTRDGKTKTVKLAAGEISWRVRPPKVRITGEGIVAEALKRLGLERFLRTKQEVDKEALLREPEAAKAIPGVTISQREDFVVVPHESQIEEVQP